MGLESSEDAFSSDRINLIGGMSVRGHSWGMKVSGWSVVLGLWVFEHNRGRFWVCWAVGFRVP